MANCRSSPLNHRFTMSPCETGSEPGLLEHPAEAFSYFRGQGAPQVIGEEKRECVFGVLALESEPVGPRL